MNAERNAPTAVIIETKTSWISRVNTGIRMRETGEQMVATALRERLNKVGEAEWLKECEREWGWSRTSAYRHLNPELLQKDRERMKEVRSDRRNIPEPVGPVKTLETVSPPPTPTEKTFDQLCADAKAQKFTLKRHPETGAYALTSAKRVMEWMYTYKSLDDIADLLALPKPDDERELTDAEIYASDNVVAKKWKQAETAKIAAARGAMVDNGDMTDEEVRALEEKERDENLDTVVWSIGDALDELEENTQYLTPQRIADLKACHQRIGKLIGLRKTAS